MGVGINCQLPKTFKKMTLEELENEIKIVDQQICDLEDRKDFLQNIWAKSISNVEIGYKFKYIGEELIVTDIVGSYDDGLRKYVMEYYCKYLDIDAYIFLSEYNVLNLFERDRLYPNGTTINHPIKSVLTIVDCYYDDNVEQIRYVFDRKNSDWLESAVTKCLEKCQ